MKKFITITIFFFLTTASTIVIAQEKIETRPLELGQKSMWLEIQNPVNGNKITTPVQWHGSYIKNNSNISFHVKEKVIFVKISLLSILGILLEGKENEYIKLTLYSEEEKMETRKTLLFGTPTTVVEVKVYE